MTWTTSNADRLLSMYLDGSKAKDLAMRGAQVLNRSWAIALLVAVAMTSGCGSESSPDDLDRLMAQAEQQLEEGDRWAAFSTLREVQGLRRNHRSEPPDEFWLRDARIASAAGRHYRAVESATRYVMAVGLDGEHYEAALELLEASEAELKREREADERREQERRATGVRAVTKYLALRKRLTETGQGDGGVFADALKSGGHGPAMVTIPAGTFQMGCVSGLDCRDNEKPVREVDIPAAFALSVYEVTFAEWDACAAAGGCDGYWPDDWEGRGSRPVTNVSWDNANSYVGWLSGETGAEYRLPNEAEWEYAARAGTVTKYSWGNEVGVNRANCAPDYCGDPWDSEAPVGSFAPNAWGLYDMHGNVWELVVGGYSDADLAGSARDETSADEEGASSTVFGWRHSPTWLGGRLVKPVMRGGSSSGGSGELRAAFRAERSNVRRGTGNVGFRVARTLAP